MRNYALVLLAALSGMLSARAQVLLPEANQEKTSDIKLEKAADDSLNEFGFSFQMGFNMGVNFKNLGGFAPQGHNVPDQGFQPANPDSVGSSVENRTYEDGYNWVDSTGNDHQPGFPNTTWYWEYDHASPAAGNGGVTMHGTGSPATAEARDRDGDPALGIELFYRRQVCRNEKWNWGFEAAFGYQGICVRDGGIVNGIAIRTNDAFAIPPGVVDPPKQPGVDGVFQPPIGNPGDFPVLGSIPSRTVTLGNTAIIGSRNFDADIYGIRVGPYLQIGLSENVALSLSGAI